MLQRVISSIIGIMLLIIVLVLGNTFVNIGIALISFAALLELYSAVGLAKYLPLQILGLAASLAFTYAHSFDSMLLMPLLYVYIIILFLIYMMKSNSLKLSDISKMFFITVYVCFFLGHIVFIRKMPYGEFLICIVFLSAFLTDTFAYLAGRFFGKHKLCPEISPKKTIEGAIGGLIGSTIGILIYGWILQFVFHFEVSYAYVAILGLLSSAMAQFGDLAASVIKRQYSVKDYGHIMPGHGGVMDRFDSVIFTAPFIYFFVNTFAIIWRV